MAEYYQEAKPDKQVAQPHETASNAGLFQSLSKADLAAYKPETSGKSFVDNDDFQIVGLTPAASQQANKYAGTDPVTK